MTSGFAGIKSTHRIACRSACGIRFAQLQANFRHIDFRWYSPLEVAGP